MIFKLILLVAVITIVYFIFFKKDKAVENKDFDLNSQVGEELIPCYKCGTLTSENETIIHNGQQFCSKECAKI